MRHTRAERFRLQPYFHALAACSQCVNGIPLRYPGQQMPSASPSEQKMVLLWIRPFAEVPGRIGRQGAGSDPASLQALMQVTERIPVTFASFPP